MTDWSYYANPAEIGLAEDLTTEDHFALTEALLIVREFHAIARRDGATEHAEAYGRYFGQIFGELERRLDEIERMVP